MSECAGSINRHTAVVALEGCRLNLPEVCLVMDGLTTYGWTVSSQEEFQVGRHGDFCKAICLTQALHVIYLFTPAQPDSKMAEGPPQVLAEATWVPAQLAPAH